MTYQLLYRALEAKYEAQIAEAEATLQKEAELQASILKQILGGKQQIAGYKKAKPKKK
jgi:hypothetical protein